MSAVSNRHSGLRWAARMVELLLEQRQMDVTDFPLAWARARALCAVPISEPVPRDGLSFASFFERQCEREWNGLVSVDYAGLGELAAMLHDSDDPRVHQHLALLG